MKPPSQPTAPDPSPQPTPPSHPARRANTRSPRPVRTLVVDDSPFGLKTLVRILAIEGNFAVAGTATDGCQAILKALSLRPELVLLDHQMPILDGIDVARYLKQLAHPPLVIIVTSDNSLQSRALAKAAGADGFVDKGGNLHAQLHMTLQELFDFAAETMPRQTQLKHIRPSTND